MKAKNASKGCKQIVLPTLALTLIVSLTVLLVSAAYLLTKKSGGEDGLLFERSVYQKLFPNCARFERIAYSGDSAVLETLKTENGNLLFTVEKKGYSSTPMVIMVGLLPSGEVEKIQVAQSSETAGLGDRVKKEEYLSQFYDKSGPFTLGEDIDALAGATYSSRAVVSAVNTALDAYATINGGESE